MKSHLCYTVLLLLCWSLLPGCDGDDDGEDTQTDEILDVSDVQPDGTDVERRTQWNCTCTTSCDGTNADLQEAVCRAPGEGAEVVVDEVKEECLDGLVERGCDESYCSCTCSTSGQGC